MGSIKPDTSSTLRRRNSIASSLPIKLDLPPVLSSSFPNGDKSSSLPNDFELVSLQSQTYTSLRDLMPSSPGAVVQSPTGPGSQSGYEISIKNRLVKQAAWAYLQPMSSPVDSSGRHFFRRMWTKFSGEYLRNSVSACIGFINRKIIPRITRVFDRLLGNIWVGWRHEGLL
ncbi:PREDICTED: uncharacterized protein LOC104589812 [Nelumbo nucifera]|uniref:Uncharacterized protein LOC104589812 n=2 Tax=Nelumbo nucifera TaxID=4432 RepID=A0A1U7ZEW3_NELNU|nr:PREDICTED: uncharacterized protein LOC104589812 [Nelumbo nucifera]DAD48425.1 TPA_asm: hypothetical protein HUJ06_018362 [Nelumbo nucifera]